LIFVSKTLSNHGKNAKNEGSQVEFEQIVQTVSLALQTHFWLEYFYPVLYLFILQIQSLVFATKQTGSRTPWDKVPQYPVYFTCPIIKQVTVYFIIL